MPVELLKKLWIGCHLLYPESSQAREIFLLIIESEINHSASSEQQIFQALKRLYKIYHRRAPIKSPVINFDFTSTPLSRWKIVLQKCNKIETFTLMVILLELATYKEISEISKLPLSQVNYIFNQSVKKVLTSSVFHYEPKKGYSLKSFGDSEPSSLYVYEHFIEYVLGISDEHVTKALDKKTKDNNRYLDYRNEILKLKIEVSDILVDQKFSDTIKNFENYEQIAHIKKLELKQKKWLISGVIFLFFVVLTLITRPSFLIKQFTKASENKIVVEEIEIKKTAKEPVPTEITQVSSTSVSATNLASDLAQVKTTTSKPNDEPISDSISESKNGVYKGSLTVTDFEQVTDILRNQIVKLGGKKAGEVELGWIKNKKLSYFHFIIPEEKRTELLAFLNKYSEFTYKFIQHPRKLQAGQNRFIIEVHKGE